MQPGYSRELPQRFSRQSLNIIIFAVVVMILVLSQTKRFFDTSPEADTSAKSAVPTTEQISDSTVKQAKQPATGGLKAEALAQIREEVRLAKRPTVSVDIKHWQHESGAKVLFVASPEIPMLDIKLTFDAGSARDEDLPGLARMTNNLIGEGTDQYTVDDIARQFEELGSVFETFSARDMGIASLRTLTAKDHLDPSLKLFMHIVSQPSFPKPSIERVRNIMKLDLEKAKASPGKLIAQATWDNLYPAHPYASHPGGTLVSLEAINQGDMQGFHKKYYTQANLTLALIGAIDWEKAKAIATEIIESLPKGAPPTPLPPVTLPDTLNVIHIPFPSQQTHIRIATLSTTQNSASVMPLNLGNDIFGGGGFASKLNKIIRQENGLAYSVYSQVAPMQAEGTFVIDLQTKNENARRALELTKKTLGDFIQTGPDDTEIDKAKENIIAGFPLGLATNSSILGQISYMGYYNLPLDYLDQYTKNMAAITKTELMQTFRKHIGDRPHLIITLGPNNPAENATVRQESKADK